MATRYSRIKKFEEAKKGECFFFKSNYINEYLLGELDGFPVVVNIDTGELKWASFYNKEQLICILRR